MNKFSYRAITADGQSRSGTIEAPAKAQAVRLLQQNGLVLLGIEDADEGGGLTVSAANPLGGRISAQQIMEFSSETSALLDANIPLEQVLKTQADLCSHERFKETLTSVWQDVNGGASFADALSRHPKVFERFFVNMVRGGEASGALDLIMRRIAALMERRQQLRSKVIGAMIYPVILLAVGTVAIAVLMVFVIPKFAELFEGQGRLLPLTTRILLGISDFCVSFWWLFLVVAGAAFAAFKIFTRNEDGQVKWGRVKLKTPLLGNLMAEAETSRFCRMLSALLDGQVPILQAISITGGTLSNAALRRLMRDVYENVQGGKRMGPVLQESLEFPELASRMITMGEDSGELGPMLDKVAERYEEKVTSSTDRIVSVLEPVFLIFMGIIVGFIVISMMSAIMSMSTSG